MRAGAAVILALAIGLAGCASDEPERVYTPRAANELQSVVLEISEAASIADYAAAAGSLDELEAATIAAFARGELSSARYDAIMVAIGLVRSDLEVAIQQEAEATREPTPTPEPVDAGSGTIGGTTGGTTVGTGATTDGGTSGSTGTGTGNGNGRGNPGEPGPPDDRGKPSG
ncbi:hypothetical protein [Yonghaparkia sp. Soil809]|uniref:hypothetical protein n=1 Tax=Yonghaparkia sp. Soil809 TaxID=1736417 RepID=UPI0006FF2760|nr:hypothetical protein [Yonghaparkia sp. Soil809]KRF31057.1 hypothetical protein ASG83_09555 [Yonghaparkia sp. Soil809]